MSRCLWSQNAPKKKTWDDSTTFTARAFRRRRVGGRAKEDVAPGVVVFASRFWDGDSGRQRRATTRSPMPDADEEEGSVLDLPEEYVRAVPSRRPDIFPDLKEIKQPMPNPLPGDPEIRTRRKRRRKGKKIQESQGKTKKKTKTEKKFRRKKRRDERRRKRTRSKTKDRRSPARCNSIILSVCCNEIRAYFNNALLRRVIL